MKRLPVNLYMWVSEWASDKCILMLENWNCEQTHSETHTLMHCSMFSLLLLRFLIQSRKPTPKRINAAQKDIEHCFATILMLLFGDGFLSLFFGTHVLRTHTHTAHLFNIHIIFLNSPRHTAMWDCVCVCKRVRFSFLNMNLIAWNCERNYQKKS